MSEPGLRDLVAIVAAMEEEIAPLRERLQSPRQLADGPRRYTEGVLRGVPVVLAVTGEGKRNADLGIRCVIQKCRPTRVLVLGLAGALSAELIVGELLVSSEVMEEDTILGWPDLQWLEEANLRSDYELGRIITVDQILSTPDSKLQWWGRTIRDQPAVADMESACFARVAIAYNLPYLIVRAVSDSATETLPAFLEDCRSQDGRIDRRQVMWKAFWRPRSWGILFKQRRRMRKLTVELADFAEGLIVAVA